MRPADIFGEAFRAAVREQVREELRALGVVTAATEYTSDRLPPELPQGEKGRRTFARWNRSGRVQGATPCGKGWRCSVDAWRAARAVSRDDRRQPAPVVVVRGSDEDQALAVVASVRRTA